MQTGISTDGGQEIKLLKSDELLTTETKLSAFEKMGPLKYHFQ